MNTRWCTVFVLLAVGWGEARAQAWTQTPGNTYLKLSYGASTAGEQYTFDGRRKPYADNVYEAAFHDRSVYGYAELGVLRQLTLVVAGAYRRTFARDDTWQYAAGQFGDLRLGARYTPDWVRALMPAGGALAVNASASLPMGYYRNIVPAPGFGQVDLDLTLDYGQSLFGGVAYAQVGAGYRARTPWYGLSQAVPCGPGEQVCVVDERPDLGDALLLRAEVGVRPWSPLLLQALGTANISLQSPSLGFGADQTIPTHERVIKAGVGVVVEPHRLLALSAQGFVTPWGHSTARSVDLFFGVSTQFEAWSE